MAALIASQLRDVGIIVSGLNKISKALDEAHSTDDPFYGDGFFADFKDAITVQTDAGESLGSIEFGVSEWQFTSHD